MIVVNYHYVRPSFDGLYAGVHGLTPRELESQLVRLAGVASLVSPLDVRAAARGSGAITSRAVLITFDDGLREQWEHAMPVLSRLGVPALFFVNTAPIASRRVSTVHKIHLLRSRVEPSGFHALLARHAAALDIPFDAAGPGIGAAAAQYPYDTPDVAALKYALNCSLSPGQAAALIDACFEDRMDEPEAAISERLYMDVRQLVELDALGCLGSHAHEHVPLGLLPREAAARQVRDASLQIESWTGRRPFALSYPYGSKEACPPDAGDLAREQGIEIAFTMERARIDDFARPLHLPRIDCRDLPQDRAALEHLFDRLPPARWFQENTVVA